MGEYEKFSREGLIDMLEEATERMTAAETRIQQLEAKASKLPVAITSDSLEKVLEAYRDNFGVKTEKANEIHRAACEEVARLQELESRNEKMEDALQELEDWSRAYPLEVFPEPDLKKARQLLEAGDMTLDAISAHAMRHLLVRVVEIVNKARIQ